MDRYLQLMCKDVVVAEQQGGWVVHRPELLPHNLDFESEIMPEHYIRTCKALFMSDDQINLSGYRQDQFSAWLSRRVLSIDRINAKKILNALRLSQNQSPLEKAKISMTYRSVSLCDSWWLKFGDNDPTTWESMNLFTNSLNEAIALIGLSGGSLSVQASHGLVSEIATKGSYAKGWFREEAGNIYLYKASLNEFESEREVLASQVIDCFNVYANLKYTLTTKTNPITKKKSICSKCLLMSNPDTAVVHAAEFDSYLMRHGSNVIEYAKKFYKKEFSQMIVIDYLIANSDRHFENWGFFRSMITGEILGLHPLYDHNNAFDPELLKNEGAKSILIEGHTMKRAAEYAIRDADLRLLQIPDKQLFPDKKAYSVFVERCKQLGLWNETLIGKSSPKFLNLFGKK